MSLRNALLETRLIADPTLLFAAGPMPTVNAAARIGRRLERWKAGLGGPVERRMAALSPKPSGRAYVAEQGIAVPRLYYLGSDILDVDFAVIPPPFVVKPALGHSTKGVVVYDGTHDLIAQMPVQIAAMRDHVRDHVAQGETIAPGSLFMIEEKVEDFDRRFPIPRDFKVFCAGGHAWWVQVVDRNAGQLRGRPYLLDGRPVPHPISKLYTWPSDIGVIPPFADLAMVTEQLSRELPRFLRIDCYMSKHGPVFGEFTPYPSLGAYFTPVGDRAICRLMDVWPDDA